MSSHPSTMQACIEECLRCHRSCLQMATTHCLHLGGRHTEPAHLTLMLNCAELCLTAAHFMIAESALHAHVCAACAKVCSACADSCESVGDMDDCVQACRACADSCAAMAG